jgi:hypothetical protein
MTGAGLASAIPQGNNTQTGALWPNGLAAGLKTTKPHPTPSHNKAKEMGSVFNPFPETDYMAMVPKEGE